MSALSTVGVTPFPRHGKRGFVPLASDKTGLLSGGSITPRVSYCRVDAAGVPAEWIDATVATEGQPTFVYFLSGEYGAEALEQSRPSARDLAVEKVNEAFEASEVSGGPAGVSCGPASR
jgi:hypothetical protein